MSHDRLVARATRGERDPKLDAPMPKGFECECGTFHPFGFYVAAHWTELLIHTCEECGAKHAVINGIAKLKKKGKPKGSPSGSGK